MPGHPPRAYFTESRFSPISWLGVKMPKREFDDNNQTEPDLAISLERVCFVIIKARQFDAKDETTEPDVASNPSDDHMASVLEEHEDDPVEEELRRFIIGMSVDEQIDLVALAWLGRNEGELADWQAVRDEATRRHTRYTPDYLLGMPLLADYLEAGLDLMGLSCQDVEMGHL